MGCYTTSDFYTAAVLISEGFKLLGVTDSVKSSKIKQFAFKDTPELRSAIILYANGDLKGSYRDFRNAVESVKELIYNS